MTQDTQQISCIFILYKRFVPPNSFILLTSVYDNESYMINYIYDCDLFLDTDTDFIDLFADVIRSIKLLINMFEYTPVEERIIDYMNRYYTKHQNIGWTTESRDIVLRIADYLESNNIDIYQKRNDYTHIEMRKKVIAALTSFQIDLQKAYPICAYNEYYTGDDSAYIFVHDMFNNGYNY